MNILNFPKVKNRDIGNVRPCFSAVFINFEQIATHCSAIFFVNFKNVFPTGTTLYPCLVNSLYVAFTLPL